MVHMCKSGLRLRMARVTELYHAYEEFNDKLILLDLNDNHKDEFINFQERFYLLVDKIDELLKTAVSDNAVVSNGAASVAKRRIKQLEALLSNFDITKIGYPSKMHSSR